ncbi:MAG: hypothetical protein IJY08_04365 [Clostridia bacterium]|nr:hypothetical protein [Clostridia bacterium]
MKKYEKATANVLVLEALDVITMSVAGAYEGEELPDGIIRLDPLSL